MKVIQVKDKLKKNLKLAHKRLRDAGLRMDSLVNAYSGLGTDQDPAIAARPTIENRLDPVDIDFLLLQNDLARRIVEEIVDDALRQGFEVRSAKSPGSKEKGKLIEEPEHLDIKTALREAAYAARGYGGAAVVLMYDQNNAQELAENAGPPEALLVVDRYECAANTYEEDSLKPNFGKPVTWNVSPNAVVGTSLLDQPVFHDTRLLRLGGAKLPSRLKTQNDGWDDSVLQACWTPLQNFCSAEQAIANIIQRFEVGVYSIAGLADVLDDPTGSGDILSRFRLMQQTVSMVNAVVIDKEAKEDYQRTYSQVNGLDTLWDRLAHSVAKAAKMPMTQLFGMSPSGLATDDQSGRANWRKQVAVYQRTQLEPLLKRYYRLLNGGKPVEIFWQPLDEAPAKEQAEIEKLRSEARETYVAMGAAVAEEFRPLMEKEGLIENAENPLFEEMQEPAVEEGMLPGGEGIPPREDPDGIPAPADEDGNEMPENSENAEDFGNDVPVDEEE